ncbi:MAG: hypothetical protein H0U69_02150, partial [Trueperaceae bacterium]|nr:hypothetical protein [Trueperaceae bacterium]
GGATTAPVAQDPAPPPFSARTADPLVGTFSDGDVTLEVQTVSGEYVAEIHSGGETYQIEMGAATTGLAGRFMSGGFAYDFTADLHGDVMILTTGGTTYRLQRRGDPFGTPTDATSPGSGAPELLAVGPHASLRRDDAVAFIEALEFVLSQLGYPYRFDGAEREEAIELLAQAFPHASHHDQLVLADARTIWERVQVGWSAASEREQREFALGVLILAFGEETVRGWVGATGSGGGATLGGGAGCSTFEECTSRFVDERTWTDTFNSQGCWAAAGCDSYDGSTGSFTFSDDY